MRLIWHVQALNRGDDLEFPVFDLSQFETSTGRFRQDKAAQLDRICRETGFLVLKGHGVDETLTERMFAAVRGFFEQPTEIKNDTAAPYPGYPYGWLGPDKEALARSKGADTPPDLKESFNGGPLTIPPGIPDPQAYEFCYQPTLWPDLPGFRETWEEYYAQMEALAARVMAVFAAALELPEDFFVPFIGQPISALRALHYPGTQDQIRQDQQRAGAHTDYGSLTILRPQPGSSGLQINRAGIWIDVPAPAGAFVINIGDLMARWTADRWVSTLHRVVAKPGQPERYSLAFFHQPDWMAEISPLDGSSAYPMVRSGPYLMEKFQSTAK